MSRPERPLPPPLEGNDRVITGTITSGFVVALIVLLILHGQLPHADRWWIWVAAFGAFLGLFGFVWVPILKGQRERASARSRQAPSAGPEAAGGGAAGHDDGDTRPGVTGPGVTGPAVTKPGAAGPADTGHADTDRTGQPGGARRP